MILINDYITAQKIRTVVMDFLLCKSSILRNCIFIVANIDISFMEYHPCSIQAGVLKFMELLFALGFSKTTAN